MNFARLGILATLAALLIGALGGRAAAQPADWYLAGTALSDDGGAFRFEERALPDNLIDLGLTYVRVTSGDCGGSAVDFVVYEADLTLQDSGDRAWAGRLAPIGRFAPPLEGSPDDPNVYLIPRGSGSVVTVVMDGVPAGVTFAVCFRYP